MGILEPKVVVLQALIQGESYGLEVIERVRKASGGRFVLPQGLVYPVLRSLEADGLLESREGDKLPERGGRPRIYYQLTAKGLRTAREDARAISGFFRPAIGGAR